MGARLTKEQLEQARSWGFSGEGELDELIGWLTSSIKDTSEASFMLCTEWGTDAMRWIADIEHSDWSKNITRKQYDDIKADTALGAVFNLVAAIHQPNLAQ